MSAPKAAPTVDEYLTAAHALAALVRAAFDKPGSVQRPALLKALQRYERLDRAAKAGVRCEHNKPRSN